MCKRSLEFKSGYANNLILLFIEICIGLFLFFSIDADKFQSRAKNFIIEDDSGKVVFGSSPGEVSIGADRLRILGDGGAVFDHSVETPLIRSESGQDLR